MQNVITGEPPVSGTPLVIIPPTGFEPLDPTTVVDTVTPSTATDSATPTAPVAEVVRPVAAPVVMGISAVVGADTIMTPADGGIGIPATAPAPPSRAKVLAQRARASAAAQAAYRWTLFAAMLRRHPAAVARTVATMAVVTALSITGAVMSLRSAVTASQAQAAYRDAYRQETAAASSAREWAESATWWKQRAEQQRDYEARRPWYKKLGNW